jgi:hypothetical protein
MDAPFVAESNRIRQLAAEGLQAWWAELPRAGVLEIFEPPAPMAITGRVASPGGRVIAEFSAVLGTCRLRPPRVGGPPRPIALNR